MPPCTGHTVTRVCGGRCQAHVPPLGPCTRRDVPPVPAGPARPPRPPQPGQAQRPLPFAPGAARGPTPAAAARSWVSQAGTAGGARRGSLRPAGKGRTAWSSLLRPAAPLRPLGSSIPAGRGRGWMRRCNSGFPRPAAARPQTLQRERCRQGAERGQPPLATGSPRAGATD